MNQLSLVKILSSFRKNVEQKARTHATQNHLLHAAEPEEAKADGSGQHHHRSQQKRLCDELMVLQPVACDRKARAFGRPDIARELPKRHTLRRRETVAYLAARQCARPI